MNRNKIVDDLKTFKEYSIKEKYDGNYIKYEIIADKNLRNFIVINKTKNKWFSFDDIDKAVDKFIKIANKEDNNE